VRLIMSDRGVRLHLRFERETSVAHVRASTHELEQVLGASGLAVVSLVIEAAGNERTATGGSDGEPRQQSGQSSASGQDGSRHQPGKEPHSNADPRGSHVRDEVAMTNGYTQNVSDRRGALFV
jgi:hypothetical protein